MGCPPFPSPAIIFFSFFLELGSLLPFSPPFLGGEAVHDYVPTKSIASPLLFSFSIYTIPYSLDKSPKMCYSIGVTEKELESNWNLLDWAQSK
ncbi:hypothetical protein COY33_02510 [candidate division WWE3 bacterium CG_4_10_14_0_2_um_filter_42_7]|uniref:Uncharacterized protein n=2 Tax=Katanobacteria TaxID=422282 RepID=A0A2H0XB58_UNCKA|nr:MAG: hypothetical protein COT51_02835 [candidate division WWE3 bacterium CG08_land_8_20_14_0_20_41_15]PIZ42818.1 MAG: hypothetical protein COY33_02510 [candidate division WWE3 bacterium CG_4_10_14_0_2_um_filter_42_7]